MKKLFSLILNKPTQMPFIAKQVHAGPSTVVTCVFHFRGWDSGSDGEHVSSSSTVLPADHSGEGMSRAALAERFSHAKLAATTVTPNTENWNVKFKSFPNPFK